MTLSLYFVQQKDEEGNWFTAEVSVNDRRSLFYLTAEAAQRSIRMWIDQTKAYAPPNFNAEQWLTRFRVVETQFPFKVVKENQPQS